MGFVLPKYISIITGEYGPQIKTGTSREKACNFDSSCVNCSLEVLISFHIFRDTRVASSIDIQSMTEMSVHSQFVPFETASKSLKDHI